MKSKPQYLDESVAYWAQMTPEKVAIRFADQSCTYSEFDSRVANGAFHLAAQGVSGGSRVGVSAAKSIDLLVAILAILRLGAAYVPIDPTLPDARVRKIVHASRMQFIYADTVQAERLTALSLPAELLNLTEGRISRPEVMECVPETPRSYDDLAYILYTSGSTGKPKGICHTHRSGVAYATMARDLCGLTNDDTVSHVTPTHFDMSIFDVFSTLLAGAIILIVPEMYAKVPASLSSLIEKERITVWYSVPFALQLLVERGALDQRDLTSLRVVMFAGEQMSPSVLKSFSDHAPRATYLNAYGPTETNHCVTMRMVAKDLDGVTALPIGKPDRGVDILINAGTEDADTGELLVASEQVMTGYLDDPHRTESAFDYHPGASVRARRYYKTGDIVRRDQHGDLILLGRKDRQIKLRGFRIELDDVEAVLRSAEGVSEAAVIFDPGRNALEAFVSGPSPTSQSALLEHCALHLPAQALPDKVRFLDRLDRTSTGKVDRQALLQRLNTPETPSPRYLDA